MDTVAASTVKVAEPISSNLDGVASKTVPRRRIIAEDPEWNMAPVEKLSNICVKLIVSNFEKNPVLKRIPAKYRNRIIASISIDTPLSIAAPLIPDESYWERRSKKYFRLANVKDFGNSWKRLYFELHTRDLLEKFQPESDSTMAKKLEDLIPQIQTAAPFVKVLHLREFRPVEPRPPLNFYAATDKLANKSELTALMKDIAPDHLDLTLVLPQLSNLTDFSVYYGVKNCGIDFKWQYFGLTITDSAKLAAAIQVSSLLRVCIPASGIDDDRCKILCHSLIINKTVTFLDLSHNKITSEGARSVARLLAEANGQLKNLILTNNQLGPNAGMCLGKAMALNKSLKSINLRLNRLGEEGGINLLSQLKNNHTLTEIDLSGTSLVSQCIPALATLLKCNDSTLVSLDLSCNKLGNFVAPSSTEFAEHQEQTASSIVVQAATASPDLAGKAILEAISLNKVLKLTQYITKFDIRMTEISPEYHIAIQGIVSENGAC